MKLCKDCKHFSKDRYCKSPRNTFMSSIGKPTTVTAYIARLDTGLTCGSSAKFFEALEEQGTGCISKFIKWFKESL